MSFSRRFLFAVAAAVPVMDPLQSLAQKGTGKGKRQPPPETSPPPIPRDDFERTAFEVLDDIHKNQRFLNISRDDGRLLRIFAESGNVKSAVELGTSTGYSGIWLALALRRTGGRLTTFEIDPARAASAAANFKKAGLHDLIDIIVGDAHKEVGKVASPIDLVFSDADKEGYLTYFRALAPKLRINGLFISDNMAIPEPDPAYIRAITTDPDFDTVFFNMHRTGVAVSHKRG